MSTNQEQFGEEESVKNQKMLGMTQGKRTVLLTGANGNIGREVLKMLYRRRSMYEIRVLDQNNPKNREYFDRYGGKIKCFLGDITNSQLVDSAVERTDVIIHLAAVIPPLAYDRQDLVESVNVGGTRNIVEAMKRLAPDAMLLYSSSVACYGDRLLNPYIKVGDPLTLVSGDNYAEGKIKTEALIQKSGIRYSIFRLSAIMGAGNHKLSGLLFRTPLEQLFEITTPKDTARAFVNALDHLSELEGRIFNLGGGAMCTTTYEEFLKRNFEIYGLGVLDFPLHSFATQNFHCGYYEDGDDLEKILHFRHDTLEDYYAQLRDSVSPIQRLATRMVAPIVKSYLLSKSEPYRAWVDKDGEAMSFFFRQ